MSNAAATKRIEIRDVCSRDWTRFGTTHAGKPAVGHHLDITPGASVRLHGVETNRYGGPKTYDLTFKLGGVAVYHTYNLVYTGKIVSIGAKSIGIEDSMGSNRVRVRRLDWHEFSSLNRDYDAAKIADQNHDTMRAI